MSHRNLLVLPLALIAFGGIISGCSKSGSTEALPPGADTPGGAVSAPPEVKVQIQAAEAAESARRAARPAPASK